MLTYVSTDWWSNEYDFLSVDFSKSSRDIGVTGIIVHILVK